MLHVTNGDSVVQSLRRTGISGAIIAWRDALHEGPVPAGLLIEGMSEVRARFIAGCGWASFPEAMRQLSARDAALRGARRVTLWFEHDLYDQLQLLQILATLAQQPETKAEMIVIGEFAGVEPFYGLGQLTPAQLASLWPKRQSVTANHLQLGTRAWKAFTSPNPAALREFVRQDLTPLPFVRPALERLLEEFPAPPHGLSRTDRQILEAIAEGAAEFPELFRATQAKEAAPFAGDTIIRLHVDALATARNPLLTTAPYQLTDFGRRVLAGEIDNRQLNGIDRWIGGVRLKQ